EIGKEIEIEVTVNSSPKLNEFEVTQNGSSENYNAGSQISVDPSDLIEISPDINWGDNTVMDEVIWEMQNPQDPDEWIAIPFGETASSYEDIKLTITDFGLIEINRQEKDIRNTSVVIRATLISEFVYSFTDVLKQKIS